MNTHEFLTPQQTAELLQLPKRTVLALCRRGMLGARKLGRLWRIPRDGVREAFGRATEGRQP